MSEVNGIFRRFHFSGEWRVEFSSHFGFSVKLVVIIILFNFLLCDAMFLTEVSLLGNSNDVDFLNDDFRCKYRPFPINTLFRCFV